MVGLQFSALIPILVILIYKPTLNLFFRLLFASILLSAFFDFIGTVGMFVFSNNREIQCVYYMCNTILITYMWREIPFYNTNAKKFIATAGVVVFCLMVLSAIYFGITKESFIIIASLNVLIGIGFPLFFYYQKLRLSSYSSPLNDPYFFAASGYILFSLSSILILTGFIQYESEPFMVYIWVFRQLLYFVYNIIIGYAFYILHISQVKSR